MRRRRVRSLFPLLLVPFLLGVGSGAALAQAEGAPAGFGAGAGTILAQAGPAPALGYEVTDAGPLTVEHTATSRWTAERVADLYEDAADAVRERLGLPLPERPHAIVAPNDDAFVRRYEERTGHPPSGHVLAVAFSPADVILIRQSGLREGTEGGLLATLTHELAHLALARLEAKRGARLPRWLNEGLAEFAGGRSPTWEEASALEGWARFEQLPDFASLRERFPDHGDASSRAYLISAAFVEWLDEQAGVRELVAALEQTPNVELAFEQVLGGRVRDAELAWRAELTEGHRFWRTLVFSLDVWRIAAILLVIAFVRVMWRRRRLQRQLIAEERAEDEAARRAAEAARRAAEADSGPAGAADEGP